MSEPVKVPLPGGLFALVDTEDGERVLAFRWHLKRAAGRPGYFYAQRTVRLGSGRDAGKTSVAMHRFVVDAKPGDVVDHANGDTLDNRRANLRVCTARDNATNVTLSKNQKRGGYKGVGWHKGAGKWEAYIGGGEVRPNGKRRRLYLGLFVDPADAARAYDAAALRCFGEFAALNFPPEADSSANDVTAQTAGGQP